MSYAEDLTQVGRTIGRLLTHGETAPPLDDPEPVLAARHILITGLLSCFERAAGIHPRRTAAAGPTTHPVPAMAAAMRSLATGPRPEAPSQILDRCRQTDPLWASAARAAIGLEVHLPQLGDLEPTVAWAVVRDLAAIAATIPYLDRDLLRRTPTGSHGAMGDLGLHADLRVAADEVVRLADSDVLKSALLVQRTCTRQILRTRRLSRETAIQSLTQVVSGSREMANRDIAGAASAIQLSLRRTVTLATYTGPGAPFDAKLLEALEHTAAALAVLPPAVNAVANTCAPDRRLAQLNYLVADWARHEAPARVAPPGSVAAHAVWATRAAQAVGEAVLRTCHSGSILVPVDSEPADGDEPVGFTWGADEGHPRVRAVAAAATWITETAATAQSQLQGRLVSRSDDQAAEAASALAAVTRELDLLRSRRTPSPVAARRPLYPSDPPRRTRQLSR